MENNQNPQTPSAEHEKISFTVSELKAILRCITFFMEGATAEEEERKLFKVSDFPDDDWKPVMKLMYSAAVYT